MKYNVFHRSFLGPGDWLCTCPFQTIFHRSTEWGLRMVISAARYTLRYQGSEPILLIEENFWLVEDPLCVFRLQTSSRCLFLNKRFQLDWSLVSAPCPVGFAMDAGPKAGDPNTSAGHRPAMPGTLWICLCETSQYGVVVVGCCCCCCCRCCRCRCRCCCCCCCCCWWWWSPLVASNTPAPSSWFPAWHAIPICFQWAMHCV